MKNQSLLYVRVSSADQEKEGYSLDAQERLGHEYAHRKDLQIIKTWKISKSAWRSERDAFNQMIEFSKRHAEVEHIMVMQPFFCKLGQAVLRSYRSRYTSCL